MTWSLFHNVAAGSAVSFAVSLALALHSAAASEARANEAVECSVRAQPDADWLRLEAFARSETAVAGRYRFSVLKKNAAGTSQNMQSGSFALVPGQERTLTTLLLEKAAEGHYRAQLTLTWDDGSIACVSP